MHYSNYNNSEDFWFYLNNVAICFQKYNFANPTGQWSLRVPLPLRFQDKNSFLSFVNSNAPDGKSLYAENYSDSTINVSDLGGVTEGIVHILTIGKVKWFYFLNNLINFNGVNHGLEIKVEYIVITEFPYEVIFKTPFNKKCLFVFAVDDTGQNDAKIIGIGQFKTSGCNLYSDSSSGTRATYLLAIGY